MRPLRTLCAVGLLLLLCAAVAQRSAEAEARWQQALSAQRLALGSANVDSPDQPLWREAIAQARAAVELAPNDPEVVRTLAQTYSYTLWHVRAWEQWLRYLELGGRLDDPNDRFLLAEAGSELGYARYVAGNRNAAIPYYQQVLDAVPDDEEALTWLGRIYFESNQPEQAAPYWQRLAELRPDDAGVAYYLERTRQRLAVGVEASDAFQQGITAYEQGRLGDALTLFQQALAGNDGFLEAIVWAARTSLELGQPRLSVGYWDRVLALDPADERSRYFREVAQAQIDWGVEAADAFYRGQASYTTGDLPAANAAFVEAARANPGYPSALVWAARTHQELGNPTEAIGYWQSVLRLDPDDDRARYFLTLAQQQLSYGIEAGQAFVDGVSHFQRAEFAEAEEDFTAAVDANGNFAAAWGWLGRLYFSQARYSEAADAYERAAQLEPGNDDYAFFAAESRRLTPP